MELKVITVNAPSESNMIIGMAHFIKTTEDLYEAMVNSAPGVRFGLAFCESSGPCLVRSEGNDAELRQAAVEKALELGAGHSFLIFLKGAYPINVLDKVRQVPEVCTIHCATANSVQVILAETEQGRGILGVVDGLSSKGIETPQDFEKRRGFLRAIGYKL